MKRPLRLAVVVVSLACQSDTRPDATFRLQELRSIAVPSGIEVRGAAVSNEGRIVYWNAMSVFAETKAQGTVRSLNLSVAPPVVGASFVGDDLQIVDARSIRVFDAEFRESSSTSLQTTPQAAALAIQDDGWFLGAFDSDTSFFCVWRAVPGSVDIGKRTCSRVAAADDQVPAISSRKGSLVLTYGGVRWRVYLINPGTSEVRLVNSADSSGATTRPFVALPAVWLDDSTVIQTLADASSDNRRILTYRTDGSDVHAQSIDVPMGIAGLSPSGEWVIAVRDLGRIEMAIYRLGRIRP